jgi:pilus assembly protein CpaD
MPRATLLRTAGVLALAFATTACGTLSGLEMGKMAEPAQPYTGSRLTPTEQFGVQLAETPDRIQLAPAPGALSPAQVGALSALARRWQAEGQGEIRIETPAGGQNAAVASQAAYAAQQVLQNAGVPPVAVVMTAYNATGQAAPTVAVGFNRLAVITPKCADYVSDVTRTGSNEPYRSFGCAVTANLGVQIADPADLLGPRAESAPDSARRAVVLDTYRRGKPTGTPRASNPAESSDVSDR